MKMNKLKTAALFFFAVSAMATSASAVGNGGVGTAALPVKPVTSCKDLEGSGLRGEVFVNFDGSITISNPLLMANGQFRPIAAFTDDKSSEVGLCRAFGKSFATSQVEWRDTEIGLVYLNEKGTIYKLFDKKMYIPLVETITCR